jgi:hypothetical protein
VTTQNDCIAPKDFKPSQHGRAYEKMFYVKAEIFHIFANTDLFTALALLALADTLATANFVFRILATAAKIVIVVVVTRCGVAVTFLAPKVIATNASATFVVTFS